MTSMHGSVGQETLVEALVQALLGGDLLFDTTLPNLFFIKLSFFLMQSPKPEKLFLSEPTSEAGRVRA